VEIGCIIEGHGEEDAARILIGRIVQEIDPAAYVPIRRPIRRPTGQLRQEGQLGLAIELMARQLTLPRAILVLLDADDDCPAELGPRLLGWAQAARRDIPIAVVAANRKYEAWFLAAAESLRGHRGLPYDLVAPPDPEGIRGAKEWLAQRMPRDAQYAATEHQASFSQTMSLEQARRAPSFDKLCRDVGRLVDALRPTGG
jgi:hypothetical protein